MRDHSALLAQIYSSIGHFFAHLLMLLYPTVVLALEDRFDWTYGELLALSLPGFILFGAGALPAGWLGDRWSSEGMMVLFFIGTGAGALITGLAPEPLTIGFGLAVIGLFGSIYHPVGIAWLVRSARNRGRALGWNGISGTVGVGTASLLAGALTEFVSWRAAFLVPGAVCVGVGLLMLMSVRSGRVSSAAEVVRREPAPSRADVVRTFFVLSVTMMGAGLIGQALSVAMPKLFDQRLTALTQGTTLGTGGFVTLVFLISAMAQIIGGWLADRYPLKPVYVWSWVAQVPLFLLAAELQNWPLFITVTAVSFIGIFALPAENSLLARYTPAHWRATAFGAKFVLSLGVSAAGVPLVAVLYDFTGGFFWLFVVFTGIAAVVVGAATLLPSEGRRSASAQTAAATGAE